MNKYIIQQRGYYTGGKGYSGVLCNRLHIPPSKVYKSLNSALRDARNLSQANAHEWEFVVYLFIPKDERQKQIQGTIDRLPKDETGKPLFRTEGAWNCQACHEEGFTLNAAGYYEPCAVCEGTGVLEGEWQNV